MKGNYRHGYYGTPTYKSWAEMKYRNGNYEPGNCRWATDVEQARNTSRTHLSNGKTLSEWSEVLKIKISTLAQRIYVYRWPLEKALGKEVVRV